MGGTAARSRCSQADATRGHECLGIVQLTSGKVPLEKTLEGGRQRVLASIAMLRVCIAGHMEDLHEQTGLSTGAVADNDELATDLGHGVWMWDV